MENICQSLQNIVIQDYSIGALYEVNVTFINHPHSFYIQPRNCSYLNILEKPGQLVESSDLTPGAMVVYNSQISNKYIRGRVVAVTTPDGSSFDIFAIDYGHVDKAVDIAMIHLPEITMHIPPLAKHCRLSNCQPIDSPTFSDDVAEAMQTFIGTQHCQMKVKGFLNDLMIVILKNNCFDDIATLLYLTLYSNFERSITAPAKKVVAIETVNQPVAVKSFKVNDVIHIFNIRENYSIPNTYFAACVDEYNDYLNNWESFAIYCRRQPEVTKGNLQVGRMIGHRPLFALQYERAVIKTITLTGHTALIFLIDQGQTIEAVIHEMKEIQRLEYYEKPGIAFQCIFHEDPNKEHPQYILPGYDAWVRVKEIGDPIIVEIIPNPNK